jgi:hypothetical protein
MSKAKSVPHLPGVTITAKHVVAYGHRRWQQPGLPDVLYQRDC